MKKSNYKLLNRWLGATIADNPKIIIDSETPTEIYRELYLIWLKEVQQAMKELAKQLI